MGQINFLQIKSACFNFLLEIQDFHRRCGGDSKMNVIKFSKFAQLVLQTEALDP